MPVRRENGLKEDYSRYEARQLRQLCKSILPERRQEVLERVKAEHILRGRPIDETVLKLVTKEWSTNDNSRM